MNGARVFLTSDSLAVRRGTGVKFAVRLAPHTPVQAQYAFPDNTIEQSQVMTTINTPRSMISRAAAMVCLPPRSVGLDVGRPKCRPWSHQTHAVRTRVASPPSAPCTLRSILSPMSRGSCVKRNHSSGGLDYGSLMAAPGTPLHNDIMENAARRQTGVSLKTLIDTGRGDLLSGEMELAKQTNLSTKDKMLIQVASFLHRELPIRLAHRVRDLESMPYMLAQKSVQQVREWYLLSFKEIRDFPRPMNIEQEAKFAVLLKGIYQRHAPVLLTMARGVWELRKSFAPRDGSQKSRNRFTDFYDFERVHNFLDGFYMSRIGIRILIGHYLALQEIGEEDWIGMVCQRTSPAAIAEAAIQDAKFVCTRQYGDAPDVTLHGRLDLTFSYVPSHLHYIMLELIKNSMRATVDFHGLDEMDKNPIRVVIADGEENEDVVIKVADEGGGIRRSNMNRIWSYLFTTADPAVQEGFVNIGQVESDHAKESPLAGLGYGLPISRSYARYFGGDLSIVSMEGFGTDAFVHLSRLGNHSEPLP